MIEISRGASERLILHTGTDQGPQDTVTPPTIDIYDLETGELLIDNAVSEKIDLGRYAYSTPLWLSYSDRELRAVWSYSIEIDGVVQDGMWEQLITVNVPYTTPAVVADRFPDDEIVQRIYREQPEQLRDAERTVRYVINSFVGQRFTLETNKTYEIRGRGLKELYLPKRLARLTKIEDEDGRVYGGQIDAFTNFSIRKGNDVLPYSAYTDGLTLYGAPIGTRSRTGRWDDKVYLVTGDWGWTFIPHEVTEATNLLVRDSMSPDTKYFEMYVDNIRAADWRMEFVKTGDRTTGNAKADLMLSRFHTGNWTLI